MPWESGWWSRRGRFRRQHLPAGASALRCRDASASVAAGVVTSTTALICVVDLQGRVVLANPALLDITGFQEHELVDRLMFWKAPEQPGTPLDSRREAQRLRENSALGREVTEGETPIIQRSQSSNPVTRIFESIF